MHNYYITTILRNIGNLRRNLLDFVTEAYIHFKRAMLGNENAPSFVKVRLQDPPPEFREFDSWSSEAGKRYL